METSIDINITINYVNIEKLKKIKNLRVIITIDNTSIEFNHRISQCNNSYSSQQKLIMSQRVRRQPKIRIYQN